MSAKLVRVDHPFRLDRRKIVELDPGTRVRDALPKGNWAVQLNGVPIGPAQYDQALADGDYLTAKAVPSGIELTAATYFAIGSFVVSTGVSLYNQSAAKRSARHAKKGTGAVNSAPFYAVSGASNQLRPFGAVQQHYGRVTAVPDFLMPPLTTISDSAEQVVQCLYCVGKGFYTPVNLSAIKYGQQ